MQWLRVPLSFLIVGLIVIGLTLIGFRHFISGVPFTPGESQALWAVEAKIEFEADGGPVQASLALPPMQQFFLQTAERTASPGFGLHFQEVAGLRRAEWAIRRATGPQTLYYLAEFQPQDVASDAKTLPPAILQPRYLGSLAAAAGAVLLRAHEQSADALGLAKALVNEFHSDRQDSVLLLQEAPSSQRIVELLAQANIPARTVEVLILKDGARRQHLREWVQFFDGGTVHLLDPVMEKDALNKPILIWEQGDKSVIDLVGAHGAKVGFSILKRQAPLFERQSPLSEVPLLNMSIHSLPINDQSVFKGILLVPVGVLLVVIMRTLVGLQTSGTFMPVLIALAFMQTSLLTGIVGFLLIVGAGLVMRAYLAQHNLLLVARISLVIVCVVLILAFFSVMAYRLGLSEGLKLTLFPMIILSWTIERMSILWEEDGHQAVFVQGGGSLFVAILSYLLMTNEWVRHLTFNFMGLQFIFMAIVLMCGSYTGYRLLELKRFSRFSR